MNLIEPTAHGQDESLCSSIERPRGPDTTDGPLADLVKRELPVLSRPLIKASDALLLGWLATAAISAAVLPQSVARAVARSAATVFCRIPFAAELPHKIQQALNVTTAEANRIVRDHYEYKFRNSVGFFEDRFKGKSRHVDVEGLRHVEAAHEAGKGAVIWIADTAGGSDLCRLAFHNAGYPLNHMMRPEHGFSASRFGIACLNPFKQDWERQYLASLIMYNRNNPSSALDAMDEALRSGGFLSVLATTYEGRTLAEAPFLGGRAQVAAGPLRIAFQANCPIMPAFLLPEEAAGRFRLVVQAPLTMSTNDRQEAIRRAAGDYFARLELIVRQYPAAWRGWGDLRLP